MESFLSVAKSAGVSDNQATSSRACAGGGVILKRIYIMSGQAMGVIGLDVMGRNLALNIERKRVSYRGF